MLNGTSFLLSALLGLLGLSCVSLLSVFNLWWRGALWWRTHAHAVVSGQEGREKLHWVLSSRPVPRL